MHAALSKPERGPEGGNGEGVDPVAEELALAGVEDRSGSDPLAKTVAQQAGALPSSAPGTSLP